MKFMAMMNSINFFKKLGLSMVAVLAISSCVKENMEPMANDSQDLMTISLSTGIQTKTTMTPGVPKLSWTKGDKFDLFSNGGDTKTTPAYTSDDAVIEARVDQGATEVYAVYPAVAASTKSSVAVTIPAAQTQTVAGKMNGNNMPMYAQGTIEDGAAYLSFKPVAGIFALNIYSTEATEAKVAKVQVNPLDAEGNFIYSGYCGTVTTKADEFSYAPTQEVGGVTLTLGTPCEIASEKPADNAATLNFANQLYIAVARGTYAGLQFIITTNDGKMYVAKTTTARSFEQTDVHYLNINLAGKDEISDDFYGQYNAGLDLTICGNVINKKTHPKAKCIMSNASDMWDVLAADYKDDTNGGVLFIDNTASPNYRATTASKTFGKDKIIIGRYRSANQAVLKLNNNAQDADTKYYWVLDGKVMIKNITLSSYKSTRSLFVGKAGAAHGASQFYFEDCTLTNTSTSAGILMENDASWAVPSSMRFDNCILRANAEFISADGKGTGSTTAQSDKMVAMQNLKKLEFNNCVFAPATVTTGDNTNGRFTNSTTVTRLAKNGAIVALYNINHYFDDLDITLNYCTIYDMGASSANRGLIDVTTVGDVVIDRTVVYNSAIAYKTYLLNPVKMCTSASLKVTSSNYENPSGSQGMVGGAAGNIKGNPADGSKYSVSFGEKSGMFGTAQPNLHYFPTVTSVTSSGASYDTKYWVVPTPAAN